MSARCAALLTLVCAVGCSSPHPAPKAGDLAPRAPAAPLSPPAASSVAAAPKVETKAPSLSDGDREWLAMLGATCAPAYRSEFESGYILHVGCAREGTAGAPPVAEDDLFDPLKKVTRGSFLDAGSEDVILEFLDARLVLVTKRDGKWTHVRTLQGPFSPECRLATAPERRDLLVCLSHDAGAGGGRVDGFIIDWTLEKPTRLFSAAMAIDHWWILCYDSAVGVMPSYFVDEWRVGAADSTAGDDVEVSLVQSGWSGDALRRLKSDTHFEAWCTCEGSACETVRPPAPSANRRLVFTRIADSLVPTPETHAVLREIAKQWSH